MPAARSAFILPALCLITGLAWGAERTPPLTEQREYLAASKAMDDGQWSIAAIKARRLLDDQPWPEADAKAIASIAVEGLVRSGQGQPALDLMAKYEVSEEIYWQGLALLLTGEAERAAQVLSQYPPKGKLAEYATLARSHALLGDDREGSARTQAKPLRESSDPHIAQYARLFFNELEIETKPDFVLLRLARETGAKDATVQYLRARALLEQQDLKTAEAVLRDLLLTEMQGKTSLIQDSATVLLAEVLWRKKEPEARGRLLAFINSFNNTTADNRLDTRVWPEAFALLERLSSTEKRARETSLLSAALPWLADTAQAERHGFALFFAATELHRDKRDVEAASLLEALLQMHPRHPRSSEAMRLLMQLHGVAGNDARVLQLASLWQKNYGGGGQAVVKFLVGSIHFMRGEYVEALKQFTAAADGEVDPARRRRALFNAAASAIQAGRKTALASLTTQLVQASAPDPAKKTAPATHDTAADLALEKALQLAGKLDPAAEAELKTFIEKNASHPRLPEAAMALAEFRLMDVPVRVKEAGEALDLAQKLAKDSEDLLQRIAFTRVWVNEAQGDLAAQVKHCDAFLTRWPQSSHADEVQMKLAETCYRQENYARARTEFENLVTAHPNSPFADAALYFAGLSAMAQMSQDGINAAISNWDDLAERGGPLAFAARHQQAIATRRKGDNENALKLYDTLIAAPEATGDTGYALRCEKAELLISLGKKEPARYEEAITVLRAMLKASPLPYLWASRGGVMLALALREHGKNEEALEACYDVVNIGSNVVTAPSSPAEFLWFYRAGFLAVDMLEAAQQWEPAARMAEKIAATSGDRSQEAAERANKIRLTHFLWDGAK